MGAGHATLAKTTGQYGTQRDRVRQSHRLLGALRRASTVDSLALWGGVALFATVVLYVVARRLAYFVPSGLLPSLAPLTGRAFKPDDLGDPVPNPVMDGGDAFYDPAAAAEGGGYAGSPSAAGYDPADGGSGGWRTAKEVNAQAHAAAEDAAAKMAATAGRSDGGAGGRGHGQPAGPLEPGGAAGDGRDRGAGPQAPAEAEQAAAPPRQPDASPRAAEAAGSDRSELPEPAAERARPLDEAGPAASGDAGSGGAAPEADTSAERPPPPPPPAATGEAPQGVLASRAASGAAGVGSPAAPPGSPEGGAAQGAAGPGSLNRPHAMTAGHAPGQPPPGAAEQEAPDGAQSVPGPGGPQSMSDHAAPVDLAAGMASGAGDSGPPPDIPGGGGGGTAAGDAGAQRPPPGAPEHAPEGLAAEQSERPAAGQPGPSAADADAAAETPEQPPMAASDSALGGGAAEELAPEADLPPVLAPDVEEGGAVGECAAGGPGICAVADGADAAGAASGVPRGDEDGPAHGTGDFEEEGREALPREGALASGAAAHAADSAEPGVRQGAGAEAALGGAEPEATEPPVGGAAAGAQEPARSPALEGAEGGVGGAGAAAAGLAAVAAGGESVLRLEAEPAELGASPAGVSASGAEASSGAGAQVSDNPAEHVEVDAGHGGAVGLRLEEPAAELDDAPPSHNEDMPATEGEGRAAAAAFRSFDAADGIIPPAMETLPDAGGRQAGGASGSVDGDALRFDNGEVPVLGHAAGEELAREAEPGQGEGHGVARHGIGDANRTAAADPLDPLHDEL